MKIGLITTLDTNIGDDFIREGIIRLLKYLNRGEKIEFVCINKHFPYTVYPAWHPMRLGGLGNRLPLGKNIFQSTLDLLFAQIGSNRFSDCDLIVQCGAPVFWRGCSRNEWAKPLWHGVIGELCDEIPVLNLAAGSCYPWERQSDALELPDDTEYIKSVLNYCRLTTVRDRVAHNICARLGWNIPKNPCTAFLAARGRKANVSKSGYILINYMSGGGHYDWEQGIDVKRWEKNVKEIIARLGTRNKIALLCHDNREYLLAKELDSSLEIFFPKTISDYFNCVSEAKFAICNRMHASVGIAGLGIPSVAVCTDTRLLMVEELNLPTYYVKDVDVDELEDKAEEMLKNLKLENERLLALQETVWNKYVLDIQSSISLP